MSDRLRAMREMDEERLAKKRENLTKIRAEADSLKLIVDETPRGDLEVRQPAHWQGMWVVAKEYQPSPRFFRVWLPDTVYLFDSWNLHYNFRKMYMPGPTSLFGNQAGSCRTRRSDHSLLPKSSLADVLNEIWQEVWVLSHWEIQLVSSPFWRNMEDAMTPHKSWWKKILTGRQSPVRMDRVRYAHFEFWESSSPEDVEAWSKDARQKDEQLITNGTYDLWYPW